MMSVPARYPSLPLIRAYSMAMCWIASVSP